MIKLVPFMALLSVAMAQSADSGNWGLFKIMNRYVPRKKLKVKGSKL